MKKSIATVIGFFTAPLVAAVIEVLFTWKGGVPLGRAILGLLPIFYFFAILATLIFAVPAYLALKYFKKINFTTIIVSGLVIGTVVAVIIRLPSPLQTSDLTVSLTEGAFSSLWFWFIQRLGKDEKSIN